MSESQINKESNASHSDVVSPNDYKSFVEKFATNLSLSWLFDSSLEYSKTVKDSLVNNLNTYRQELQHKFIDENIEKLQGIKDNAVQQICDTLEPYLNNLDKLEEIKSIFALYTALMFTKIDEMKEFSGGSLDYILKNLSQLKDKILLRNLTTHLSSEELNLLMERIGLGNLFNILLSIYNSGFKSFIQNQIPTNGIKDFSNNIKSTYITDIRNFIQSNKPDLNQIKQKLFQTLLENEIIKRLIEKNNFDSSIIDNIYSIFNQEKIMAELDSIMKEAMLDNSDIYSNLSSKVNINWARFHSVCQNLINSYNVYEENYFENFIEYINKSFLQMGRLMSIIGESNIEYFKNRISTLYHSTQFRQLFDLFIDNHYISQIYEAFRNFILTKNIPNDTLIRIREQIDLAVNQYKNIPKIFESSQDFVIELGSTLYERVKTPSFKNINWKYPLLNKEIKLGNYIVRGFTIFNLNQKINKDFELRQLINSLAETVTSIRNNLNPNIMAQKLKDTIPNLLEYDKSNRSKVISSITNNEYWSPMINECRSIASRIIELIGITESQNSQNQLLLFVQLLTQRLMQIDIEGNINHFTNNFYYYLNKVIVPQIIVIDNQLSPTNDEFQEQERTPDVEEIID